MWTESCGRTPEHLKWMSLVALQSYDNRVVSTASWGGLGRPRSNLGRTWSGLGAVLGRSWPLWCSWAAFGSEDFFRLVSACVHLCMCARRVRWSIFGSIWRLSWVARRSPKESPRGDQHRPKPKTIFKSEKQALQDRLGPCWSDLGPFWAASWGRTRRFLIETIICEQNRRFQRRWALEVSFWTSWLDLVPKRALKEVQERPKTHQKRGQNDITCRLIFPHPSVWGC